VDLLERLQTALAGRYRIERELGRGGMATVYLAEDLKHGRRVALKVLRPELSPALGAERFQREIETASRLQHPHILTLHDSGEAAGLLYYAMPYVEGESLRSRLTREVQLDAATAVGIASDVADALACAHAAGVLHRDIKPENILLTGGHAVVADFGIARALDAVGADRLTETGLALGTPHYMSPEQAAGARVLDARSDIYALGCVVYEMLAGEPPFNGPTSQAIMARHALDPVPSLRTVRATLSPALEAAVGKALAKVPADRFATAAEFKAALERALREPGLAPPRLAPRRLAVGLATFVIGAGVAGALLSGLGADPPVTLDGETPIRSLAVAPLVNLTGDSSQLYLADGVTEELIAALTQISALRVISLRERRQDQTIADLAKGTGADAILGGALQRTGDALRITTTLSSVVTGQSLWAAKQDGDVRGILALKDRVVRSVADRIRVSLAPQERARLDASRQPVNPAAYEAYARGQYFKGRDTEVDFRKAIGHFRRAIELDPAYAPAYDGLASCYLVLAYYALEPPAKAYGLTRAYAMKALEFDSSLGHAHSSLAHVQLFHDWNFDEAESSARRALQLSPKHAGIHFMYGMYLTAVGRFDEAAETMSEAQHLDPLALIISAAAARPFFNGRRYEGAIAQSMKTLELDSTYPRAHYWAGMAYAQTGRAREALSEFDLALRFGPTPVYRAAAGYALALMGERGKARAAIRGLAEEARTRPVSRVEIAAVHAALGEKEEALESLRYAVEARDPLVVFLGVDPRFDAIRQDPRFTKLLRVIGLPANVVSGPP
jgi:Serine/threonine protein kinase